MSAQMELDLSVEADTGEPCRILFLWPPESDPVQHQVQAFVVMRRQGGVLLALPDTAVDEVSLLEYAQPVRPGVEAMVGPVTIFSVPMEAPSDLGVFEATGTSSNVLVVDVNVEQMDGLLLPFPTDPTAQLDISHFAAGDPDIRPVFSALMTQVRSWVDGETEERIAFYSAHEEEEGPDAQEPTPKQRARPKLSFPSSTAPGRATAPGKAQPKRPTVATLAGQMEVILASLPKITDQLAALTSRQNETEAAQRQQAPNPIGHGFHAVAPHKAAAPVSALLNQTDRAVGLAGLGRLVGPPPPVRQTAAPSGLLQPDQKLEEDEPQDPFVPAEEKELGSPMAQALLEQSKALQTLMAHFHATSSDPMSDLSSSTPTTGIKGTVAREKLQRELAAGNGQFYLKVCQAIQRRMSPTSRLASQLSEVQDVSLLAYLERYGGYGQQRELGMVQWSLAHAFDAAAKGEWGLVVDHIALTSVMVEQAALDNNKWHLAWLLRLLDDPPQNLWLSRGQTATGARRPFAPLCAQAWTTTALAYMKEAEVLTNKRTELLNNPKASSSSGDPPAPKNAPKRRPGRGKGNPGPNVQTDQEGT